MPQEAIRWTHAYGWGGWIYLIHPVSHFLHAQQIWTIMTALIWTIHTNAQTLVFCKWKKMTNTYANNIWISFLAKKSLAVFVIKHSAVSFLLAIIGNFRQLVPKANNIGTEDSFLEWWCVTTFSHSRRCLITLLVF